MISEFIKAFILIFFAEMGDKSQILAMLFASKYKVRNVIIGLTIGIVFNHSLAVFLGSNLNAIIPLEVLSIFAGLLFVIFGLWSLKSGSDEDVKVLDKYGPILTVAIAFFIGELGDKTQLTAIALSSDAKYPLIILFGTVSGMIFTSLIGIYIGIKLGSRIPVYYIRVISSIMFILFGFAKLGTSLPSEYLIPVYYIPAISVVLILFTILFIPLYKNNRSNILNRYLLTAERLRKTYLDISTHLDDICLGENECGKCGGVNCLIGYTKAVVKKAISGEESDISFFKGAQSKTFDEQKVLESLGITLHALKENFNDDSSVYLHKIRESLELIVFKETINAKSYNNYIKILQEKYPHKLKRISNL